MIDQKLLKVGGYYRTRGGHKVRLLAHHPEQEYCWICEILNADGIWVPENFKEKGNWLRNEEAAHRYDIIEVWKGPLDFDWSTIPYWVDVIWRNTGGARSRKHGFYWVMCVGGHAEWLPIPEEIWPTNWTEDMGNRFERPKKASE